MVPVKKCCFAFYYKQKTRQVMKNILYGVCICLCICPSAVKAQNLYPADYLVGAASAWKNLLVNLGVGGEIAAYIRDVQTTNTLALSDAISILAFNTSAIGLFEINHHVSQVFSVIDSPIMARRNQCAKNLMNCNVQNQTISIDGQVFGSFAEFDSDNNGSFDTRNTGFYISAKGFISNGWQLGVSYTRSMTDTQDTKVYADATSNSITMFTKYVADSGFFVNVGLNGGHTSWNMDKTIAGLSDNSAYDTDFIAGQVNTGFLMYRGRISLIPQVGVKYLYTYSDKYVDNASQEFDDWWYNFLTGFAGVKVGFDFKGSDFIIRPDMHMGGSYDFISNGTDNISVQLIDYSAYDIPIEIPHRAAFNGGLGINVYATSFSAGISYNLDLRSEYIAHTGKLNLKIIF